MAAWTDGYWWSNDGLRLHYRDYSADPEHRSRPPILCIPGLTGNAREFDPLAARLAGEWRLICVDLRGRGESAYAKDPMSYVQLTYLQDLEALVRALGIDRFVLFGHSLGGLPAMSLGAAEAVRVQGLMLNDIGPALEDEGLARMRAFVGRGGNWPTWVHAARDLAETHRGAHPDWQLEDWLRFAKCAARLNNSGRIVLDYDMRVAEPFRIAAPSAGMDMWAAWRALAHVPALLVRGERSDTLSDATASRMAAEHPGLEVVTVPGAGHAPTLDEPDVQAAAERLLAQVDQRSKSAA